MNVGVDKQIGEVSGLGDASVTEGLSRGLVKPKATGYTFVGWNTDASATGNTKSGWVTSTDKAPALNAAESKSLYYYWIYDTPVS